MLQRIKEEEEADSINFDNFKNWANFLMEQLIGWPLCINPKIAIRSTQYGPQEPKIWAQGDGPQLLGFKCLRDKKV